ncbi:hypothetical protein CTheo_1293 [Ceratobasidium theobromae]|uniref:Uncharacterized protein n=1 Tax=Ceratobasidium theobromae TaxID=1582974 RepID=A0A5N5QTX4_9AGAM|nr:hypothetical protein CTheo_1293 [Ceratobasidium theobromae]
MPVEENGKNEGVTDLSYKPPRSMKKVTLVDEGSTLVGFEWDHINSNPDIDLWAVRIPAGFSSADLAGLKVKLPTNNTEDITGILKKGSANFSLKTIGGTDSLGEEMQNLHCLVPKRGDAGALYTGEYSFDHLDPVPTPTVPPPPQPSQRPQPMERLKHTFSPIGAAPLSPPSSTAMEIDQPAETGSPKKKHKKQAEKLEAVKPESSAKGKAKVKGKSKDKDKAANDTQATGEIINTDVVEASHTKQPRKKPSGITVEVELTQVEKSTKKSKKKRKSESET